MGTKFHKGVSGNPGRQFQKGVSGNPGGKPKDHEQLREAARSFTLEAVKTLASIMRGKGHAASSRVAAATVLLERGWGKPLQQVEVTRTPFDGLSPSELTAIGEALENLAREEDGLTAGHTGEAGPLPSGGVSTVQ